MQKTNSTYLYKYKKSSNYFFRIRTGVFAHIDYGTSASYFVASLQTDNYDDARWLASFIKRNLTEKSIMEILNSAVFQNDNRASLGLNESSKQEEHLRLKQEQQRLRAKLEFRRALKTKFGELLNAGKAMIEYELEGDTAIPVPVAKEERKAFQELTEQSTPRDQQIVLVRDENERSAYCQDSLHILAFTNVSGRSVFSRCFKYWNMNLRLYFMQHLAPLSDQETVVSFYG
jgi:hypothetical protein